jgi:phenylalanyl-tRNA synthetase beta chain
MLVPLSWLRDFAPFGSGDDAGADALAETFNDLGMVVEGVERVGEGLDGVVVARVLEVHGIEGADKIRRVLVDDGSGEPVQVVCGAWNFEAGAVVPFARVGAVLPGDFEIGRRKMKGVESHGMICSGAELRMGGDGKGILLLDPDVAAPGTPLADALGIEPDVVFDLAIETNRPDAMSIAGVARDAAARLGLPFAIPESVVPDGPVATADVASVVVESPDLSPRFTAKGILDVVVGPSSPLVQRRLTLAGMRPINNVVDASNYVMLELGQPTHPYDLDQLPGHGLLVRAARPGEVVRTLDGVDRVVGDGEDCLICDANGNPVGIGGIMGGESSEISEATTRVLLEAAYFTPMAIARTSKRLGLRSEASARFERGCDPEGIERAVNRFVSLLGGGVPTAGLLDVRSLPPTRPAIHVRTARVNSLLGTSLATDQIAAYLKPIGFVVEAADAVGLDVVPPSFRPDVTEEVHVVEEVARHHGYANIERTVPRSPYVGQLTPYQKNRRHLREVLAGVGASEALGIPLIGPGEAARAGLPEAAIEASEPMAREESRLRTSLLPTLLRAVAFNGSHREPGAWLFEVGHVFLIPDDRSAPLPDERELLGVALAGDDAAAAKRVLDVLGAEFHVAFDLAAVEDGPGLHPTRTAAVLLDGQPVGHVGEVDPGVLAEWGIEERVGWIGLELERFLPRDRTYVQARPVSRFPSSDIDLAFVVPDTVPAALVESTLRDAAGELLDAVHLFDVYRGQGVPEGARSLAYRLRFQAQDRTLTDGDVAQVRARAIAAVESSHSASLRG